MKPDDITPESDPVHEQVADRIARALHNDRMIALDDTAQNIADIDWISDRYRQLRIIHMGGFKGAQRAAHSEFIQKALKEAGL